MDVSTAKAAGVLGSRALLRIPKATNKWFTSGCFGFSPKELQLSWESFHRLETSSGTNPKTYWISKREMESVSFKRCALKYLPFQHLMQKIFSPCVFYAYLTLK